MPSLLSIVDLNRGAVLGLLDDAERLVGTWAGASARMAGLLFFEPSTRTRFGFAAAAERFGIRALGLDAIKATGMMSASETLEDTVRVIGGYVDVLCLRHSSPDSAAAAAAVAPVPVINCGNGPDEHPSQALVDLFAIRRLRGRIDGCTLVMVGDLRSMRAAHSLLLALSYFSRITVCCVSPPSMRMPERFAGCFRDSGNCLVETGEIPATEKVDIVYVAGFPAAGESGVFDEAARLPFRIDVPKLSRLGADVRVLCPLPRIDEIDRSVDRSPAAAYFRQSDWALWVRAAVLHWALGIGGR